MARKLPQLERALGAPALFSIAYGEVASSIYYALGVVALHALGLTPWVLLIVGALLVIAAALSFAGTSATGFVLDAVERFGRLDIMCNVAGVAGIGSLAEVTESEIDDAIATQVKGALFGCQAALAAMAPRAAGSIINVSAVSRNAISPVLGVAAAARAAVANLTQSFAVEASRRGVRVNAFEVDADYASSPPSYDSLVEQLRSLSRLEELAAVDEHAHHLLYLCGESSKFVTGTLVRAGVRADW